MMKQLFASVLLNLAAIGSFAQADEVLLPGSSVLPSVPQHAQREWQQLKSPVTISFASSDVRYAKDAVPRVPLAHQWSARAWRGEKVHTQILVWVKADVAKLRVRLTDLVSEKGQRIAARQVTAGFVRYVVSDEFANGCGYRKPNQLDSSLVADPIDTVHSIAVRKHTVQPIWLSVEVPSSAMPGLYQGRITILADKPYQLGISVRVAQHVLPPGDTWAFDLDLWQHPAAIARVHNVPLWSAAHYRYMKPYYEMLARAGQKNITAAIIHEPWNHQTYDDFPSLIRWVKRGDGSWFYDYSRFDEYISFVMGCGISARINCYTMVPWKMSFPYYDERLGRDTALSAKTGTPEYDAFWSSMLEDFARHLKIKGWFEKTTIAMDERPMKDMQAVIRLLKSIDPAWKITLAGDYHPELEHDIFDYSIASRWQFDTEVLKGRTGEGKPSTFYTCCTEPYPNGFTFSPPAEQVWIGWYAAAKGFTGYLRWAYNSWVKDPLKDSRFSRWPAGDTYQVYPGPLTSIRFEKLIEGIQDFEKIRILRESFRRNGEQEKLTELERLLSGFELAQLRREAAADAVAKAKSILNQY